jgi:hypothetical protein
LFGGIIAVPQLLGRQGKHQGKAQNEGISTHVEPSEKSERNIPGIAFSRLSFYYLIYSL